MSEKDLENEREASGERIAQHVLMRRLFTELARMRDDGFLREQERLAQRELRAVTAGGKPIHPAIIDVASDIITNVLVGIGIDPPRSGGGASP